MVVCKNAQDLKTIIDEENPGREIIQPNSCIFLRLPSKLLKFIVVKPNT